MTTITITARTDGTTSVETTGFTGDSCREASRLIEAALGKSTAETIKPEFYQADIARQQAEQSS